MIRFTNLVLLNLYCCVLNPELIFTKAGYDANDKRADPEAYEKLDECYKVTE